ncbi:uncharacterized protein LOC119101093 [Pollicipes pollicipes]|uniref:uncharacterized protein LOC119101093 n=1 Tax=Pollicipes pollicipes TaxID=41117 RepID=UPI001885005C|nr:uncharacterized protein LOC119101093 [Pollicipes pollicipes]
MSGHLGVQNLQPKQRQLPIVPNYFLHPATNEKVTKNKLKVKLVANLLSSSVGKALLYLEESEHYEFIGTGATARFILLVDQTFDCLSSSNPYGKGFKTPVTADNLTLRREFLADFSSVLFRLQTASGEPVLQTRRFTSVLGLCLATQTVMDVSEALLEEGFLYVLSYKCPKTI